jgi:predicted TPR repeat methyltransferase
LGATAPPPEKNGTTVSIVKTCGVKADKTLMRAFQFSRLGNTVAQIAEKFAAALSHHRAGRLAEAESLYRQICAVDPNHVGSLHFLGVLAGQVGRNDIAIDLIGRAVALRPDYAEAHCNLGRAFTMQGKLSEATPHYERAISLKPNYAEAHIGLGNILREQGRLGEAIASYERTLALKPDYAEAHYKLGSVLSDQRKLTAALARFERALALKPAHAEAWLGRGRTLQRLNRPEEAIIAFRQAFVKGGDAEVIQFYLASLGAEAAPVAAPRRLVTKAFNQCADQYDHEVLGTLKYKTPDLLFDAMAPFLPSRNLDVVDLGCGTGLFGARLRPLARTLMGVDFSSKMLEIARQRQVYDHLACSELIEFLQTRTKNCDLAVAADVFVYLGDLRGVFERVRGALRDGGLFAFSVEISEEQDFVLGATLKYAHSDAYLRRLAKDHGFVLEAIESKVIRQENGIDVVGYLPVLRCC